MSRPEENEHIEAYHGTLKREVLDKVDYRTFEEIKAILQRFERSYNQERLHGLFGRITPNKKWEKEIQKTPFKNKKIA